MQKFVGTTEAAPAASTKVADIKNKTRQWARHCAAYRRPMTRRAVVQIATTALPFIALISAMVWLADGAYWATLMLALPAGGLLVRFFIIQHDCGHGSYFASRRLNDIVGRCMSFLTLVPYGLWRREHAQHHAGSGNLERRGVGDIETMTVREYMACSRFQRLRYRVYRNPLFLFLFGVPLYFTVLQRLPWCHALTFREAWKSVMGLNLVLVAGYGTLAALVGWALLLKVGLPVVIVASALGGWLFFIQHQFEAAHWEPEAEWDFQVSAVHGSSYYVLPKILQWFTGNIGLHHVHHLNSMVPNYRLQECIDAMPELGQINRLTLWESLKTVRLKLWDEQSRRLVGFRELAAVR